MDTLSSHIIVYQPKDNYLLKESWKLYEFGPKGALKPVKEFTDKHTKNYAETPEEFARKIDKADV